jgi:hypothetical protein
MSLHTPQKPPAPDGAAGPIRDAVTAVAEQSFFAIVGGCDDPARDATPPRDWLTSTVCFRDGMVVGSLACWVSPELARSLFDAFTGRDPIERAPAPHQVDDLVGEFANMVCGDWLTRIAAHRAFHLSPPMVLRAPRPAANGTRRVWVTVNDRPLAIDWDLTAAGGETRVI